MRVFVFFLLAAALVLSAANVNVSGKWSGSFSLTRPDGTNDDGTAFAVLKQEGGHVTGTAGPDEEHQWTIAKGAISGNKVTFEVTSDQDGTVFKCNLVLEGDHLKGPVSAVASDGQTMPAKVDFSRVK
ncbi:MAG: hypothetical protein WCB12_22285 [Bryobacteraceae bacterium]